MENTAALMVTSPAKANAIVKDQIAGATAGRSKILHRREFEPDFLFGAGSAAYQHEGAANQDNRGPSIWDNFCLSKPGKIKGGASATMTIDMYHNYKEDIKMMKQIGLTAFRMSISWPRIFPGGRKDLGVNADGVKFYNDLIDELLANGIQPFVTLFHWDLPQALQEEYGGLLDKRIVKDYQEYAEFCFYEFGDRVKHWITFNEPHIFTYLGFGLGIHAPGRGSMSSYATGDGLPHFDTNEGIAAVANPSNKTVTGQPPQIYDHVGDDATEPYIVAHNIILCHKAAVELYRNNFQKALKGQIGIVTNCLWMLPLHQTAEDIAATQRALDFIIGWFMEPLTRGDYPQVMKERVGDRLPPIDKELLGASLPLYDFIGVNYYYSSYVVNRNWGQHRPSCFLDLGVSFSPGLATPDGPFGTSFISAKGLCEVLRYVSTKYQVKELYVTENGTAIPNVDTNTVSEALKDDIRVTFLEEHIAAVRDAIHEGVNMKGYFVWSMFDGFEWGSGFDGRMGLVHVNYFDNLKRLPKRSAKFYREFLGGKPFFLGKRAYEDEEEEPRSAKKIKLLSG